MLILLMRMIQQGGTDLMVQETVEVTEGANPRPEGAGSSAFTVRGQREQEKAKDSPTQTTWNCTSRKVQSHEPQEWRS